MGTTTTVRFGPKHHGKPVSEATAAKAEYVGGFRYEIIDGRLYVSPVPNPPESVLENWLRRALERYSDDHPEVIDYISPKVRVYVPGSRRVTSPEPDVAAYAGFPHHLPINRLRWREISPILVAEVLVEGEFEKDLTRNPVLYLAVPSIREYWVLDGSEDCEQPTLIRHRRRGTRWTVSEYPFGSTLTTPVLPGFELVINPRRRGRST